MGAYTKGTTGSSNYSVLIWKQYNNMETPIETRISYQKSVVIYCNVSPYNAIP